MNVHAECLPHDTTSNQPTHQNKKTHVVRPLHLLKVGLVLLRHLLPPLVKLVGVHLQRFVSVGPLNLDRRGPPVNVQQLV